MDVLFQRPDLQVRSARSFGSDVCFVTFDSYSDLGTLDRPGFAESYLHGRGIDAVHILSRSNDWYLYPYSAEAFAAARAAVAGYRSVFTYGSSMGAYAAIRFGQVPSRAVAIAPGSMSEAKTCSLSGRPAASIRSRNRIASE